MINARNGMQSNECEKSAFRRVAVWLCYIVIIVALTAIMTLSVLLQMEVREDIRIARSQVQPVVFSGADCGTLTVGDKDLFLFCLKSGEIIPAREPVSRHDFMGPLLCHFNVGTNRIFVLVDKRCPGTRLEEISSDFAKICSNKVFMVGALRDDDDKMACVEWSGQLPENGLQGARLDCSVIDSLLYISPFVCNPLVGWFGDMIGVKYEVQRPWRSQCVTISSDSILDLCPDVVSNVVAVRAGTNRDSENPNVIYLDVSYYIDMICGKDPTSAGSYGKRDYALRCVSRIRKLAKEDVEDLMRYLREADQAMSEEYVTKLKIGVIELLRNQDSQPEGVANTLLGMLADEEQPPDVLRGCVQHLSVMIGELDDATLQKYFGGDSRRANAVAAAVRRIREKADCVDPRNVR